MYYFAFNTQVTTIKFNWLTHCIDLFLFFYDEKFVQYKSKAHANILSFSYIESSMCCLIILLGLKGYPLLFMYMYLPSECVMYFKEHF